MLFGDMLGDGDVQPFLAAEVIDDRCQIGAGVLGDLARAGAFEAEPPEHVERGLDEPRTCVDAAVALRAPVVTDLTEHAPASAILAAARVISPGPRSALPG